MRANFVRPIAAHAEPQRSHLFPHLTVLPLTSMSILIDPGHLQNSVKPEISILATHRNKKKHLATPSNT